ncbi:prolipoprotein diacylglyceryl transferase [Candidatus Dojkabacteria bacterium]|nr:prolipoprotein diacylglyceryl transferase [Candidatus Dojkabacteria bacterium]
MICVEILSQIQTIHIGPIQLHTYGLIIGIAVITVLIPVFRSYDSKIINDKQLYLLLLTTGFAALIGGRILYVFMHFEDFHSDLISSLYFWEGGSTIFGVIIGALAGYSLTLTILRKTSDIQINFFNLLDKIFLYFPLGQSIGRWGNYINNEIYGKPTNLPWGICIPKEKLTAPYLDYTGFHPVFFYESILDILNFLTLYKISKNRSEGFITGLFLINYGIIRITMERFRIDSQPIFSILKAADIAGLLLIIAGFSLIFGNKIKKIIPNGTKKTAN